MISPSIILMLIAVAAIVIVLSLLSRTSHKTRNLRQLHSHSLPPGTHFPIELAEREATQEQKLIEKAIKDLDKNLPVAEEDITKAIEIAEAERVPEQIAIVALSSKKGKDDLEKRELLLLEDLRRREEEKITYMKEAKNLIETDKLDEAKKLLTHKTIPLLTYQRKELVLAEKEAKKSDLIESRKNKAVREAIAELNKDILALVKIIRLLHQHSDKLTVSEESLKDHLAFNETLARFLTYALRLEKELQSVNLNLEISSLLEYELNIIIAASALLNRLINYGLIGALTKLFELYHPDSLKVITLFSANLRKIIIDLKKLAEILAGRPQLAKFHKRVHRSQLELQQRELPLLNNEISGNVEKIGWDSTKLKRREAVVRKRIIKLNAAILLSLKNLLWAFPLIKEYWSEVRGEPVMQIGEISRREKDAQKLKGLLKRVKLNAEIKPLLKYETNIIHLTSKLFYKSVTDGLIGNITNIPKLVDSRKKRGLLVRSFWSDIVGIMENLDELVKAIKPLSELDKFKGKIINSMSIFKRTAETILGME